MCPANCSVLIDMLRLEERWEQPAVFTFSLDVDVRRLISDLYGWVCVGAPRPVRSEFVINPADRVFCWESKFTSSETAEFSLRRRLWLYSGDNYLNLDTSRDEVCLNKLGNRTKEQTVWRVWEEFRFSEFKLRVFILYLKGPKCPHKNREMNKMRTFCCP